MLPEVATLRIELTFSTIQEPKLSVHIMRPLMRVHVNPTGLGGVRLTHQSAVCLMRLYRAFCFEPTRR